MVFFVQGLSLGLAYVAPIGVQNLFVINAALSQPWTLACRTACIVIFFDVTRFILGVTCASCLWFLALCALTARFKTLFSPRVLRIINMICGGVILGYALKLGWTLALSLLP